MAALLTFALHNHNMEEGSTEHCVKFELNVSESLFIYCNSTSIQMQSYIFFSTKKYIKILQFNFMGKICHHFITYLYV